MQRDPAGNMLACFERLIGQIGPADRAGSCFNVATSKLSRTYITKPVGL